MKPTRLALALVALLAVCSAPAFAATNPQNPILQDINGLAQPTFATDSEFLGDRGTPCRIESSTPTLQAIQCATGSGIVYGVDNSSGSAADAAFVADTTTLPATTVVGFDKNGIKISPLILSAGSSATGCTTIGTCESWAPVRPRRFINGLVLDRRGTSNAAVYYRLDSDDTKNPITR